MAVFDVIADRPVGRWRFGFGAQLERAPVSIKELEGAVVRVADDPQPSVVVHLMVLRAQRHQVPRFGWTAVLPVGDVMDLDDRGTAALNTATAVAMDDETA